MEADEDQITARAMQFARELGELSNILDRRAGETHPQCAQRVMAELSEAVGVRNATHVSLGEFVDAALRLLERVPIVDRESARQAFHGASSREARRVSG